MTKSEKLVQFYSECQAKGYTDMTDATQSLKAKVIASDLKLPYGKIAELYAAAKEEFEADQKKKALEAQVAAAEAERLSKPGEKIMVLHGTGNNGNHLKVEVYRREDGSIYCNWGFGKVEGLKITVEKGGVISYNYHPSKTIYTGASAGGIHMGGFHETEAYVTQGYSSTEKGNVIALIEMNKPFILKLFLTEVEIEESVQVAFKRDKLFKTLYHKDKGFICYDSEATSDAHMIMKSVLNSGADIYQTQNLLSRAVDMGRLPMGRCKEIADVLNRIIHHHYPPSDEEIYKKADELFYKGTNLELLKSKELFLLINDYKDAAQRAVDSGKCLEELKQQEKEQAILNRERFKRNLKKALIIALPILAALLLFIIILITVIIPGKKYKEAMALIEAGEYDAGYSILEEIGRTDNLESLKYREAIELLDAGNYSKGYSILKEIGKTEEIASYKHKEAMDLIDAGKYAAGCSILEEIGKTEKEIAPYRVQQAAKLFEAGKITEGISILTINGKSKEEIDKIRYKYAVKLIDAKDYLSAYKLLDGLKFKDSKTRQREIKPYYQKELLKSADTGSKVFFGTYEQDGKTENGKEDIEWLVLKKEDNMILLLSRYGLDCQPYNTESKSVTWDTCTLRKWLNETFLNSAFTPKEQEYIQITTVTADIHSKVPSIEQGNSTQDKVFLLSEREAKNYYDSPSKRKCAPTEYAIKKGAYTSKWGDTAEGGNASGWWWLRTIQETKGASEVDEEGQTGYYCPVDYGKCVVRPAMWLDLS